jgi:hypothetical protein
VLHRNAGSPIGTAEIGRDLPHLFGRFPYRNRGYGPDRVDNSRPAIDQVSDENGLASGRMRPAAVAVVGVSELLEQRFHFVATAVDVPDDVERPVLALPVVPERLTLEDGRIHLVLRLEHVNVPESFASESTE